MSGAKILVVDDELIVRESLGGWLERDGHTVDKAASGEESLEKFEKTRYDIILLDIKMEGMSGLEVLKRVKEIDPDGVWVDSQRDRSHEKRGLRIPAQTL
jgi:CheY-like chemotaxis protein